MQFSVAMETVNPKFDVQVASKKEISNWNALFFNRTHFNYSCTIYKRFQEKIFMSFREIV